MFRCVHGFASRDSMVRHKGKCLGGGKSVCPACEMVFSEQDLLHDHIVKEHQVEGEGCRQQNLMYNHSLFFRSTFQSFEPVRASFHWQKEHEQVSEEGRGRQVSRAQEEEEGDVAAHCCTCGLRHIPSLQDHLNRGTAYRRA